MYYNYIKLSTDLFSLMNTQTGMDYKSTLSTMLDECISCFLEENKVPQEKQSEFLSVMFVDCPQIFEMYKNKKFSQVGDRMSQNYFLSEYQWEVVWLINLIMSYKDSIESEIQMDADRQMKVRIKEIDEKIMQVDKKLDLILEKLN